MPVVALLPKFDERGPHLFGTLEGLIEQNLDPPFRTLYHISFSVELKVFVFLAKSLVLSVLGDLRHLVCRI
jgi:hypothetical protein